MMKKYIFPLLFSLALSCAFALDESVEAFVKLPVPTNSVETGFSSSISDVDRGITASEFKMGTTTIDEEMKVSSVNEGGMYLFYKGVGDLNNTALTLEIARPFTYFDGANYSSDPNDVIHFTIDVFCDTGCNWDGSNKELLMTDGVSLSSDAETKKKNIDTSLRGTNAEMTIVKGVARVRVTIPPTDVTGKKYGTYKAELKLTFTSNL